MILKPKYSTITDPSKTEEQQLIDSRTYQLRIPDSIEEKGLNTINPLISPLSKEFYFKTEGSTTVKKVEIQLGGIDNFWISNSRLLPVNVVTDAQLRTTSTGTIISFGGGTR